MLVNFSDILGQFVKYQEWSKIVQIGLKRQKNGPDFVKIGQRMVI